MTTETWSSLGHPIWFGSGAWDEVNQLISRRTNASRSFVLVDTHTRSKCLPLFLRQVPVFQEAVVIEVPPGESCKSWDCLSQVVHELLHAGADRDSLMVAIGGGTVCDLGAFAASVFMRGIDFLLVPTTLLAMADASTGGKCGINFESHKNMVGVFSRPAAVCVDAGFLDTLPLRELTSGWAEVIKHVFLSADLEFPSTFDITRLSSEELSRIIQDAVNFKDSVVRKDPYDEADRRQLNFGHTVGHAVEAAALESAFPLLHGEAIALGMQVELIISQLVSGLSEQDMLQGISQIRSCFPDLRFAFDEIDWKRHLAFDKKNRSGIWQMALLKRKGVPVWNVPVHEATLDVAVARWQSLIS